MKLATKTLAVVFIFTSAGIFAACNSTNSKTEKSEAVVEENPNYKKATFGSGCFWCTEAIFERVKGVKHVESGYTGGHTENPAYGDVTTGNTGHAEVIQLTYNPDEITYDELLEIFWKTHDPTTLNRQGADVGTQYRSAVFYHDNEQKKKAENYKRELTEAKIWDNPIVTEISPLTKYYKAEDYHQDYYENNPGQGYCSFVITPKLEKFEKIFKDKLKK